MMNANTNNTNVQSLTAAIAALTKVLEEAIDIAKEESTTATTATTATTTEVTTTEATETTTTATTPIVVIDDDDNVIATTATADEEDNTEFKGSMIEQEPMDPMPSAETADTAAEETATVTAAEETLDNIICDISTLYDIAEYTLCNEGCNVSTDNSPYAPGENKFGYIDNYKVYISKEIIKAETITGEFRMIVSEKNSGVKILDHSLKIIDNTIKVFSSENTVRIEKLKESKKLMRFMELVDEVSALVMSKYISK